MFQHANPVEVPYKAGSRILMVTECHKEAHKGMPLAITLRMPFLIHLQKVESLSAGVTTEEVKVAGWCTEGRRIEVFAGGFHCFEHIPAISGLCRIFPTVFHLGRNLVAVLWEVAGVSKKLITVELGS